MLQFILGIAGTGKTSRVLELLAQRAQAGGASIFVVPEQFSSSAESMVYHALGDAKSAHVEVLSFRTLAERILKAAGGLTLQVLSDAGRVVYLRRALEALAQELPLFAKNRRSPAFCNLCAQTLAELKTAGALPQTLREIGTRQDQPKFTELALIFEAYEASIQGSAMDPEDRLLLAAARVGDYFKDKHCFIDNFDGFTAPEYRMLTAILADCNHLCVSLCCDGLHETDDGLGRFSPVRHTAQRLIACAQTCGCTVQAPVVLSVSRRPETPGLAALGRFLALGEEDETPATQGLTFTNPPDEWEEARLAAAEMYRLAQTGVPYSRMALVCRELTAYESAVRHACGLFQIPLFLDAPSTIEYTAPVAFLRAALALLRQGLASAPILALLKTGLCGYSAQAIAALENYVYTWQPRAADWRAPFTKNPRGLLAPQDGAGQEQLAAAERLRAEILPLLEEFLQNARGKPAATVLKQLYLLLDKVGAPAHATATTALLEQGDPTWATRSARAWDLAMNLLDQLAALVGPELLAPAELDELLLLLVRSTDFGSVPQSLECAVFTSADRMRLADPDYCFVLGLTEGEFPMQVGYSGLLTHTDRERLVEGGIEMPGSFTNRILLEEMFLYRALTSARKGLYLSWPARRAGESKSCSAALLPLCEAFAMPPLLLSPAQRAATPRAAYEQLGSQYRDNSPQAASLLAALQTQDGWQPALALLADVDNGGSFAVADTAALAGLVGSRMQLSATRAEQFYECRFAYYMQQVLKARPRRKAELSPMESGTFVHYILEQVLLQTKQTFATCTDETLQTLANACADAFIAENLPPAGNRQAYLLGQIKASTARLLCFLRDASAQSDFSIDALELSIGTEEGGIPPLEVETPDGRRVLLGGKIDRVDTLHRDGKTYLCIVDYKTGDKAFSLDDVYCGLNMQMMIYMDALCKNAQAQYPNPLPAAVLYLTADPTATTGSRLGANQPVYKMDGLLLDDMAVLHALDKDKSGVFLPLKYTKAGAPGTGKNKLASLEKIGAIRRHVETLLAAMAEEIYTGNFPARPLVKGERRPCRYCAYRAACRHEDGRNETPVAAPPGAFESEPEGGEQNA